MGMPDLALLPYEMLVKELELRSDVLLVCWQRGEGEQVYWGWRGHGIKTSQYGLAHAVVDELRQHLLREPLVPNDALDDL